jgi:hypothetical protein
MTEDSAAPEEAAQARKRRIELRRATQDPPPKRVRVEDDEEWTPSDEEASAVQNKKPSIRGIKKQARYEPGVEMTKEELAAWRKEARRVRNRESAAASRRKTRERIEELEEHVEHLQAKYTAALQRIAQLEQGAFTTALKLPKSSNLLKEDLLAMSKPVHTVSPTMSPRSSIAMIPEQEETLLLPPPPDNATQQPSLSLHTMISRPTAD